MTVIVGVRCTDGVVVGADGSATSSAGPQPLVSIQTDKKIQIIGDRVIYASTGAVGLGQRTCAVIEQAYRDRLFQNTCMDCCREIARRSIEDFQHTYVQTHQQLGLRFGAIIAAPFGDQPELIEFGSMDFQPEIKRENPFFVSMGSGQTLADPFLAFISRVLWNNTAPEVDSAMFGVLWALSHTIEYAPGGVGNPISLAVLRRDHRGQWSARLLDEAEQAEQEQHISDIERHIGEYPQASIEEAEVSEPPRPPDE